MESKIRFYADIVYKVCQSYVIGKLASKYDLKWKDCKGKGKLESEYKKKQEKVVNDAFLAVRSHTEHQAFIDYFVSTLYPFVTKKEFSGFAEGLFENTDEIRALTLLALSSQYPIKSKNESEGEGQPAAA